MRERRFAIHEPGPVLRTLRAGSLLLAAWIAFGLLQSALARALDPMRNTGWWELVRIDLALAVFWAAVSVPIAGWHALARRHARSMVALIAAHLPLIALVAIADSAILRLALQYFSGATLRLPFSVTLTYYADFDVVRYVAVVAVADALLTRRALAEKQRVAARLEGLLVRARLDYLEAQLQPHFLFNSLGAVSELAYEAPATAARVLRQLAAIFRQTLTARSDEITLGDELLAIEPYLDIQRIRFADWLRIDYDVDAGAVDHLVPRFVLQPLVENAIRHGLTQRLAAGCIEISARRRDDRLVLRVSDNGVGLQASRGTMGYGIGLANVRDRLAILYGSGDSLRLFNNDGGGTVAELTFPLRHRTAASAIVDDAIDALPETVTPHPTRVARSPLLAFRLPLPLPLPSWLRHPLVAGTLAWMLCGLLWTQQSVAYLAARNRLGQSSWLSIAQRDMTAAMVWALLTPLVFVVTSRLPIGRRLLPLRILGYLAGAALLATFHAYVHQQLFTPAVPLWSSAYQSTFALNMVIVCVLVAIGHRRQLDSWLRARELASAALLDEVRETRARASRLQSIPPILLQALERIATVARAEPGRAEQLLARLADYLRAAIESSDGGGITAARAAVMTSSLAELERAGGFVVTANRSA